MTRIKYGMIDNIPYDIDGADTKEWKSYKDKIPHTYNCCKCGGFMRVETIAGVKQFSHIIGTDCNGKFDRHKKENVVEYDISGNAKPLLYDLNKNPIYKTDMIRMYGGYAIDEKISKRDAFKTKTQIYEDHLENLKEWKVRFIEYFPVNFKNKCLNYNKHTISIDKNENALYVVKNTETKYEVNICVNSKPTGSASKDKFHINYDTLQMINDKCPDTILVWNFEDAIIGNNNVSGNNGKQLPYNEWIMKSEEFSVVYDPKYLNNPTVMIDGVNMVEIKKSDCNVGIDKIRMYVWERINEDEEEETETED